MIFNNKKYIQSALISVATYTMHTSYQSITSEINKCVSSVISSGCELHLHWVVGHTGLAPNELADIKAKDAAMDAALLVDTPHPVTIKDIKRDARAHTIKIWQRRWDRLNEKRLIHRCHPKIRSMRLRSKVSKQAESALIRLITGHNNLFEHMSRCRLKDTPNCPCLTGRQNAEHILLHCPTMFTQREVMLDKIELSYIRNNVPTCNRSLDITTLLAPHHSKSVNTVITRAVSEFILSCPYKI